MAEKSSEKNTNSKPGFFQKIKKSFRDMKGEVKKVVWPTKQTIVNNTIVVITICAAVGVVIWIFDFILSQAVRLLLGA